MNTDSYPRLFKLIRECAQTTDRLPPEDVLAQQLGISRVKLRDMLATLQANGYISRKKGIGTLINKHMLAETARLDMDTVYEEMISESGHIPSMLVQKIKLVSDIPQEIRDRLQLAPEDTAYLIEKPPLPTISPRSSPSTISRPSIMMNQTWISGSSPSVPSSLSSATATNCWIT